MSTPLRIERVSKSFWRRDVEVSVLRDVSLDLAAGRIVGLQGARAAGKSTLLRLAAGQCPPDSGRVLIDGEPLAQASTRRRAELLRHIALVTRDGPELPDMTVREWVALPLYRTLDRRRADRLAIDALAEAGVEGVASAPWDELADTDRSLAAIAQAVARKPRVVLVDDPTAGALHVLDRERIMSLLREAADARGIAMLVAAPDFSAFAGHVDAVATLSVGELMSTRVTPEQEATVHPLRSRSA